MYLEYEDFRRDERQARADELRIGDEMCLSNSPGLFGCTLLPVHDLPHLAGVGEDFVIAEWDDDRSTDEEV